VIEKEINGKTECEFQDVLYLLFRKYKSKNQSELRKIKRIQMINSTIKNEWRDDTGLGHPTLIVLDVTNDNFPEYEIFDDLTVLKSKQIYSIDECFNRGKFNTHKLPKIKGYKFMWYYNRNSKSDYALYLGYTKSEEE
jgi:hypothetical protein